MSSVLSLAVLQTLLHLCSHWLSCRPCSICALTGCLADPAPSVLSLAVLQTLLHLCSHWLSCRPCSICALTGCLADPAPSVLSLAVLQTLLRVYNDKMNLSSWLEVVAEVQAQMGSAQLLLQLEARVRGARAWGGSAPLSPSEPGAILYCL